MERYKAREEIQDLVIKLIAKNHYGLADVVDGVVVVFREKAQKNGDRKIFGRAFAVAPDHYINVLSEGNYHFVLEMGQDSWEEMSSIQREAALDHLLCSCRVEIDEESGAISAYRVVKPDIMAFQENVDRYGMWFPAPSEESNNDEGPGDDE